MKDPNDEPLFQRIADKANHGMGTPLNIAIWIVFVLGWYVSSRLVHQHRVQLPAQPGHHGG